MSEKVQEAGGKVPEESIREVVEKLIHAGYQGVVISVLDEGNVVRVSDKGPGWRTKAGRWSSVSAVPRLRPLVRSGASEPGLASPVQRPEKVGGTVTIEDNIGGGTWPPSRPPPPRRSPGRGAGISATPPPSAETVPRRSASDEHLREAAEGIIRSSSAVKWVPRP